MRRLALFALVSSAAAFSARVTTRPLATRPREFAPVEFETTEMMTRLNYDGSGERPTEVGDDLPDDTALRVVGPPLAFALIIILGSQFVHFK
mmetsp:Transcript_32822/g.101696  ORF Transcript_32822/g.101696 Transcript_32822/m.101696 type:complete len:92 (-) Transcript_32822:58-333(-)